MKILKIFGLVVAVHAAVFMFIFAIPGCRSTGKQKPAAASDESSPVVATGAESAAPAASNLDAGAPAQVLFSPTRPGTPAATAVEAQAPDNVQPVSAYTVVKGDSLWSIAKKNNTTVKDLVAANNIKANSGLHLGQKLIIPGKSSPAAASTSASSGAGTLSYTVKSGDTLLSIARHAGTTKAEVRTLNKLKTDVVRAGQVLVLPAGGSAAPAAANTTVASPASGGGTVHIVKTGDTLGSIAHKYQVKVGDIAAANNIADPTKIRVGQKLKIPGASSSASSKSFAPAEETPAAPAVVPAAPAFDVSPVAPATDSPVSSAPAVDGSSSLVTPAPDTSASAPVIKIDDSGAPKMN